MSALPLAVIALAAAVPLADRYVVDGQPVTSADALEKKVPEAVLARIREVERELRAMGSRLTFHYSSKPADLLLVSSADPIAASQRFKDLLAAYTLLRAAILPPPSAPAAEVDPAESIPWQPIALSPEHALLRLDQMSPRLVFESSPIQNRGREPVPLALFDVELSHVVASLPDEDEVRPGYQLRADDDGVLTVPVAAPKVARPGIGFVRVRSVDNPRVAAEAEIHLTFSDSPHFPTCFLLRDSEDEYGLVLDYLARVYPQGTPWTSRPQEAKVQAKKRSAFFFAFPEAIVVPDRQRTGQDEKWVTRNQVVHQLVHPVLYEHFGPLPHWLEEGMGWNVEDTLTSSINAFCGYEGFVYDADNAGWIAKLRSVTSPSQLGLPDVFNYHGEPVTRRPGGGRGEPTFDVIRYAKALAVIRTCIADPESRSRFPGFLHAISGEWNTKGQIPGERQLAILKEHYGADIEGKVVAHIREENRPAKAK
jgi:hypothetical protein